MKKSLITRITGQYGLWFGEILLENGNNVHSGVRHLRVFNGERISHLNKNQLLNGNNLNIFRSATGDCADFMAMPQPC